jgi:hypothetical protein
MHPLFPLRKLTCQAPCPGRSAARRSCGVVRCRAGAVANSGVWYGPGSAERHEECRTAPGTRQRIHVLAFASIGASSFARSRTIFLSRAVSILKKTCINFRPSIIAAVLGGRGRDARSVTTFGGMPLRLPFIFRSERKVLSTAFTLNHSTIVRGLIDCRMLVSVYESTRIGCTEHTEASGRSRTLAGGAGRRCRNRPDLCQPARTRAGGPKRHDTRKTGARPLLKYRRVFQGTARWRSCAEAVEGRPTAGKKPLRRIDPPA